MAEITTSPTPTTHRERTSPETAEPDMATLMAAMADGDVAAVLAFRDAFGGRIAATVRRILEHRGVRWVDDDDLHGLTTDACLAIAEVAGGWSADGGAAPWRWARHRVASVVDRHVGQHADSLDEAARHEVVAAVAEPVASPGTERRPIDWLGERAGHDPRCGLVSEALARVATPRDQSLVLEFLLQQSLGDPSPAHTVADLFGVAPTTVRQQVSRVKRRLRALADHEHRFAELRDYALCA